jgi:hypothetical protein
VTYSSGEDPSVDSISTRAVQRFARLREAAVSGRDSVPIAEPAPGWCVSALARIMRNSSSLLPLIGELQRRVSTIGEMYPYPSESLHLSLLGLTQREETPPNAERVAAIIQAVEPAVRKATTVLVQAGRVNMIGNQLFIEVIPSRDSWANLRLSLDKVVRAIGEDPISYADPEPMHLNIGRLLSPPNGDRLKAALTDESLAVDHEFGLTTVEIVTTDFVLTPSTLQVWREIPLGTARAS